MRAMLVETARALELTLRSRQGRGDMRRLATGLPLRKTHYLQVDPMMNPTLTMSKTGLPTVRSGGLARGSPASPTATSLAGRIVRKRWRRKMRSQNQPGSEVLRVSNRRDARRDSGCWTISLVIWSRH